MARRWLIAGAAVLVVVAGAGAIAAVTFDPASQKDRIVQAVRRATGRELTLAGPIRIQWGLGPVLEAQDASFANMPGGTRPQMAVVARVEARLDLLPLLTGRVEIASVTLVRPDILLETDASGRGNWQFDRPVAVPGPAGTSSPGPRMTTQVDSLRIESGRVTWHNGVTGQTTAMDVSNATLDLGNGPAHILAQAQTSGTDVRLDATLGSWAQLTGAVAGPWPVKLAAAVGDATVSLDGTVDPLARTVAGRLQLAAPDLARLGVLFGRTDFPPLHDVHFAATLLPAASLPQDVSLQVGASDLGSLMPGATLAHLSLTWPAGQSARLEADGAVNGGPWHLATGLSPAGQGVALRGLALSSPFGDAAGDMAVILGSRPALRGTVVANRVDGDAIRAAAKPGPRPPPLVAAGPASPVQPVAPVPTLLFSDASLPWGALRRADADLQVSIGVLHLGGVDYRNATGHLTLQDGLAQLNPASVQSPEGRVDLSASADARGDSRAVALVVRSAGISFDALLQAAGLPGGSDATAELDAVLHATGDSPHALVATLGGHVGIAMVDGEISNAALAAALADVARQAAAGLDPNGRSHVRCFALRADIANGQVTLTALKLDSTRLELEGSGTIDLPDETLSLHLRPLVRLGIAGVAAPLRLEGPLRRPAITLDPAPGSGRTSVVIGGLAPAPDTCAPELTAARDGRIGRLPTEAALVKPPKAANLLRSFLR
jgi:uncharacterized protein involved in outer membrane biogenesis